MQVDPIKPTLKAPGTERLKLEYDIPLSSFAFKFNLRRYNENKTKAAQDELDLRCANLEEESKRAHKAGGSQRCCPPLSTLENCSRAPNLITTDR